MKYCDNFLNFQQFSNSKKNSFLIAELATSVKKDSVSKVAQGMKSQEGCQQPPTFLAPVPSISQPALEISFSV